ncbi:MAG TPA: bifunctional YncE family protein/alkaline phosphatase family protein [Gemmatimonadaceae bacterium]
MVTILIPLLLAPAQQPPAPKRTVPDPGVIVGAQQVTPAGVQSVFQGRVTGVRFGVNPAELWVAVPGSAYHLAWADNRVLGRGAFNGPSGVQAIAIDPVRGRAAVSTIGHLPIAAGEGQIPGTLRRVASRPAAQLSFFDDSARGATIPMVFSSGALGEYLIGAPAIASRKNASGHRVAVVPLTVEDRLTVVDADNGTPLASIPIGVAPIAAVVSADGSVAYVTNLGGAKPGPRDRSAPQLFDARGESVRVDARGIAERGSVVRVDLAAGRVTDSIVVARHPTGIVWDTARARLYVAAGNDDSVSVVDTRANRLVGGIGIAPFRERRIGASPTAVALSPDGRTLYVALGALNAVAVYDVSASSASAAVFHGLIPTAWYPSSLDVSRDGRHLAVGALLGVGAGEGRTEGSPGKRGRYVFAERGSVSVIEIPSRTQLAAYTAAVAANNRLTLASAPARDSVARAAVVPRAVPELPGDSSLVRHVVYIIKENRTYDQVLGDLGRGDGDSSLVIYGRDVTPNQHALAEQFVTLDRIFASGGNSADGHQWLTQANETEYALWPLYAGRSYPSEGIDPLAYSSGGFLWESAQAKGKSVTVFGEYAPAPSDSIPGVRASLLAEYQANERRGSVYFRDLMRSRYDTHSDIPSLDRILVREYPGWTQEVPDVVKAQVVLDHLREWEAKGAMPDLVMMILPSDHTVGTSPGWCVPRACVADNDLALGKIVDGLSHSSFWKDMAILVVEDDAQNGVDHVDGHRTTAFAISPFVRRGAVDHTFYSQPSVVKTIELMLGLPALSLFDLVATDMRASFIAPGEQPDYAPFTAAPATQRLDETNARVSEIRGPDAAARRRAALASLRMRFDGPDEAPSDALNRILWHTARGWRAPYPAVRQSLFFPMSRDIADEDREEARPGAPKR